MQKIALKVIAVSGSKTRIGPYALILGELEGDRKIPIVISPCDAQTIVLTLEGITTPRPGTHDLFKVFAMAHKISIKEVIIARFSAGVFYCELHTEDESGNKVVIDSRASDAVSLALRFNCPISTYDSVISQTGFKPSPEEDPEEDNSSIADIQDEHDEHEGLIGQTLKKADLTSLKNMLDEAVSQEDYELASRIHDEINRREKPDA